MKTRILSLLLLVMVAFTACDLSNESNYTPGIFFLQNPLKNNQDTLKSYYTDIPGTFVMDTIHVGDTVKFFLFMDAYTNKLQTFYLNHAPDSVARIILPDPASMDTIFTDNSDYAKGKFYMNGISSYLFFPFQYVAKRSSMDARLEFTVVSDAVFDSGFGSNTSSLTLKTPIKN
ncbi:hypothetical protein SDC9_132158 [bioreactor metagenome]|uniref:Lipoprotein n=1 Tax=bioreactor metagenome TaxID=1076179 RepID=A0A645D752_9ZZZZ